MIFIITGSRKGIGRFLTEYYLRQGHIVIGCSRQVTDLKHDNYHHFILDVSDEESVRQMVGEIRRDYCSIDILINNAGISSMNHFLLTPSETATRIMDVNYLGTFNMCRELTRLLRKSSNGRIVNFSTIAKPLNLEGEAAYLASKAAVESLTKVLAKELSHYNITVNAIGPTPIETDLIKGVSEEKLKELISKQIIKKFGNFADIVNVIDFFIKPESNFITGQIIYLGGIS